MVEVQWSSEAEKDLDILEKQIAKRIVKKITWLANNFDNITPEALSGKLKGMYKFRIGDYRVVYALENKMLVIHFVGNRKEIYR